MAMMRLKKTTSTDKTLQDLLKNNPELQKALEAAANKIASEAQENYNANDDSHIQVSVTRREGKDRNSFRVKATSDNPNKDPMFSEAVDGAMGKAMESATKGRAS